MMLLIIRSCIADKLHHRMVLPELQKKLLREQSPGVFDFRYLEWPHLSVEERMKVVLTDSPYQVKKQSLMSLCT